MSRARVAGWAAGLMVLALSLPAAADQCRRGSIVYYPNEQVCVGGTPYTCQDNGAWVSHRGEPCRDPVLYTRLPTACRVSDNHMAASGVRQCLGGKINQCSAGSWVELDQRC